MVDEQQLVVAAEHAQRARHLEAISDLLEALSAAGEETRSRALQSIRSAEAAVGIEAVSARRGPPLVLDQIDGRVLGVGWSRHLGRSSRRRTLLAAIAEHGDALDRPRLYERVWELPYRGATSNNALFSSICRLRSALRPHVDLQARADGGYRLTPLYTIYKRRPNAATPLQELQGPQANSKWIRPAPCGHASRDMETAPIKDLVRRQMNRSGNLLMCALEPLSEDEFFAPGVNGVSAAWTVGHLACVTDLFNSWLAPSDKSLRDETHQVFNSLDISEKGHTTKAALVDPKAYSKQAIFLMFRQAQVRVFATLAAFDVSRWRERPPFPIPDDTLPTMGSIWENLAVHTYWHMGELSGVLSRFHGTYSLNTLLHYFYDGVMAERVDA